MELNKRESRISNSVEAEEDGSEYSEKEESQFEVNVLQNLFVKGSIEKYNRIVSYSFMTLKTIVHRKQTFVDRNG